MSIHTNTPPQYPTSAPQSHAQHDPQSMDESVLSRDDVGAYLKGLVLRYRIERAIEQNDTQSIVTGVTIADVQTDQTLVRHNQDTEHFAASINKLPVSLLVLEDLRNHTLNLDQVMTWLPSDVRVGAGVYDQPGAPLQATLGEIIYDLLNRSGNTAVRVTVNGALGGAAAVNERWSHIPQLSHTYLQPLDANRFFLGFSTPHDSMWAMEKLMATKDTFSRFMKDAMATNIYTDVSVRSQLAGNEYIILVNKVGLLDDVDGNNRHDVGIIYNKRTHKAYSYSLMTTSPFTSTTATPRAEQSLKDMGRSTLRFAGDKIHNQNPVAPQPLLQRQPEQGRILY